MIIESGKLSRDALAGKTAVVTGAGRGIGFEAARALVWLGARVAVAEIDPGSGREAAARLESEFGSGSSVFVHADVGRRRAVRRLRRSIERALGPVDVVINNATITPMGPVTDVSIDRWDSSYRVNLRGPVLLAQAFLPGMLDRDYGVFICVSSVREAYMGAYETFKAAQVHLASTLDAELEGKNVHAFAIGPGLVRTPGAVAAITELAPLYGKTVEAFFAMSEDHILSAEAAGAGIAAAVVLRERFRGQETSSVTALRAAGIDLSSHREGNAALTAEQTRRALDILSQVRQTLREQAQGWSERPLFERQWMFWDFRKHAGMPVDQWLEALCELEEVLKEGTSARHSDLPLDDLSDFYSHMQELARGYESDPEKLAEQLRTIKEWERDAKTLAMVLGGDREAGFGMMLEIAGKSGLSGGCIGSPARPGVDDGVRRARSRATRRSR